MGGGDIPTILVVENDRNLSRILGLALEEAGFQYNRVSNGREALQTLEERPPDAVVLDLGLPDGLGGAVLDHLRSTERRGDLCPAWVVISALDREDVDSRYGPLGDRFLVKPFNPWELIGLVETLLSTGGR